MDSIRDVQQQCIQDSEAWFPNVAHDVVHHALCMAGEVGEFCNIIKKVERGSIQHTSKVQLELAMELTDVFIYVANIAACLNVDLGAAYDHKRGQNVQRFGRDDQTAQDGVRPTLLESDGEGS